MNDKTLIIAEAGVNHNGDLGLALELIDAAAAAGADVVKFQSFSADRLATATAPTAAYQRTNAGATDSQLDMLRELELSVDAHSRLIEHASKAGIEFLSSAFDVEGLELLHALDLQRVKVPSGEITNLPYLRRVGELGLPTLVSTGMSDLQEVQSALGILYSCGTSSDLVTVLQCNTAYPTPFADVNLRAMVMMGESLGVDVGYSDHTNGIDAPIAAVALGASAIEKHFTLDRKLPGPDHRASLEPDELGSMVSAIRNIELALGDGQKRPSPSELPNREVVRKSLVAARPIQAGEKFSGRNLTAKRPGTGISPMRWHDVIGQQAPRNFDTDELIEL